MPRAASPESESESERIPSKKQKKREESPVDDPMDEDDGEEAEYEIEAILDSSKDIFPKEIAYFVKWKGYEEEENSWVRESDAPNADELIAAYKERKREEEREREKAKKKAAAKPRKSTEPSKQEPKKRARVSTKSKEYSDEEEPERSPVQPITKKQRKEKEKAPLSTKKRQAETNHDNEDLGVGDFATMDRYMHQDSWEELIDSIDTIERDEGGKLFVYGTLTTKEHFRISSTTCNSKFPQKIIKFYEDNLRWKATD